MTRKEDPKRREDLAKLEEMFNESPWLLQHLLEPLIGDPNCPEMAETYGITRASCYTVFVELNEDETYGCRFERCHAYEERSLEEAIRHQRYHHFDHRPFECISVGGARW